MQTEEKSRVLKQLLAHLEAKTTSDAGGIRRNPVDVYTCPELAKREQQVFFRDIPLFVGLSSELTRPGAYHASNELGVPILMLRDADGVFRAFLNVCRHRGAQVVQNGYGYGDRFYCPFHAWGYDTQGHLVSLPHGNQFGKIDRSCHGLTPLPAAEKYGMLWIRPTPGGDIDVDAQLGALAPEMAAWGLERHRFVGSQPLAAQINWKLAVDTFGENYHFEFLHRNSLAEFVHGNLQTSDHYGRNYRMVFATKNIEQLPDLPQDEWNFRRMALTVYFIYPNVIAVVGQFYLDLFRIVPDLDDPTKSVTYQSSYVDPDNPPIGPVFGDMQHRTERLNAVLRDEDYATAATCQRGALSGAQTHVTFGRNEPALHHYHNTFREALGLELLPLEVD